MPQKLSLSLHLLSDTHHLEQAKTATSHSPLALAPVLLCGTPSGCRKPAHELGSAASSAIADLLHNRAVDDQYLQAESAGLEALLYGCNDTLAAQRLMGTIVYS